MSRPRSLVARAFWHTAVPLASYYAVTLIVPFANGAARSGDEFAEHAVVVLLVPVLVIVLACAVHALVRAAILRSSSWLTGHGLPVLPGARPASRR